jgi:hypothetical protein
MESPDYKPEDYEGQPQRSAKSSARGRSPERGSRESPKKGHPRGRRRSRGS